METSGGKAVAISQDRAEFFCLSSSGGGGVCTVDTGDMTGKIRGPE